MCIRDRASTTQKLMNLDLQDSANLVSVEKEAVGYAAESLMKQIKCTEKEKLVFKNEFKNLLTTMIEKFREKSHCLLYTSRCV